MLPYELKKDIRGIPYVDDNCTFPNRELLLDVREDKVDKSIFYGFKTSSDYIIKRPIGTLGRKNRIAYMDMLVSLLQVQSKITRTEFPIGYYRERRKLEGLVIRYYSNGISLDRAIREGNLNLLKKYYSHSEDDVQNLFMLLDEYLECLYELIENDIYYYDIILNNIVLDSNQVKIIDFDPTRVVIAKFDNMVRTIFSRYIDLVSNVLNGYNLITEDIDVELALSHFYVDGYYEAKSLVKQIESRVKNK